MHALGGGSRAQDNAWLSCSGARLVFHLFFLFRCVQVVVVVVECAQPFRPELWLDESRQKGETSEECWER